MENHFTFTHQFMTIQSTQSSNLFILLNSLQKSI